jgi:hypothetical protein
MLRALYARPILIGRINAIHTKHVIEMIKSSIYYNLAVAVPSISARWRIIKSSIYWAEKQVSINQMILCYLYTYLWLLDLAEASYV